MPFRGAGHLARSMQDDPPETRDPMSKAAEIDIVSVSKIYGSAKAVDNVSLKIPPGT